MLFKQRVNHLLANVTSVSYYLFGKEPRPPRRLCHHFLRGLPLPVCRKQMRYSGSWCGGVLLSSSVTDGLMMCQLIHSIRQHVLVGRAHEHGGFQLLSKRQLRPQPLKVMLVGVPARPW